MEPTKDRRTSNHPQLTQTQRDVKWAGNQRNKESRKQARNRRKKESRKRTKSLRSPVSENALLWHHDHGAANALAWYHNQESSDMISDRFPKTFLCSIKEMLYKNFASLSLSELRQDYILTASKLSALVKARITVCVPTVDDTYDNLHVLLDDAYDDLHILQDQEIPKHETYAPIPSGFSIACQKATRCPVLRYSVVQCPDSTQTSSTKLRLNTKRRFSSRYTRIKTSRMPYSMRCTITGEQRPRHMVEYQLLCDYELENEFQEEYEYVESIANQAAKDIWLSAVNDIRLGENDALQVLADRTTVLKNCPNPEKNMEVEMLHLCDMVSGLLMDSKEETSEWDRVRDAVNAVYNKTLMAYSFLDHRWASPEVDPEEPDVPDTPPDLNLDGQGLEYSGDTVSIESSEAEELQQHPIRFLGHGELPTPAGSQASKGHKDIASLPRVSESLDLASKEGIRVSIAQESSRSSVWGYASNASIRSCFSGDEETDSTKHLLPVQSVQPDSINQDPDHPSSVSSLDSCGREEITFWKVHKGRNKEWRRLRYKTLKKATEVELKIGEEIVSPLEWIPFPARISRAQVAWDRNLKAFRSEKQRHVMKKSERRRTRAEAQDALGEFFADRDLLHYV
ncbi:hypothetical protein BU16DRAFT_557378 [Lophium mytilinum]|uniref:Uncharacterized protein n=1 Tax=Lophium mytilinum TaxID=390894 RepID=A0A6A6R2U5_9PEZI|nr:hypothetical protein BU16DRAFT_557378 [Lophium mytilinum]